MAVGGDRQAKKVAYFEKVTALCSTHNKVLVVTADNIGSSHMMKIRRELRTLGVSLLMGKNTQMRRAIRNSLSKFPQYESLLPLIAGNIGLVFAKDSTDLGEIRKRIHANKVGAPAKAGSIAPSDVSVPAGPTGMEPTMTSFLQALNIPSKISKGQVEITSDVMLIKEGEKVGASAATLLQRLKITPFAYSLKVVNVFDNGFVYEPSLLDISDATILGAFGRAVNHVAAISLEKGMATSAVVAKLVVKALSQMMAVSLATEYTFSKTKSIKEVLADPTKLAALQAASAASAAPAAGGAAKKEEKKEEEKKEEVEEDFGGGGLFGGGDDY